MRLQGLVIGATRGCNGVPQGEAMAHYMTEKMQRQVWDAWGQGLSVAQISRLLPTRRISVQTLLGAKGGIRPAPRRRSSRVLSAAEREWIGEGLAAGCSLRMIARHLKRAPSTISREVKRNQGAMRYPRSLGAECGNRSGVEDFCRVQ